jgi:probable H4MPT-linked C1 transfer pathway protein
MKIAGLDIGGANTDLAIVEFSSSGEIKTIKTHDMYLPMWMENERLGDAIISMLGPDYENLDAFGVSMTAELVDAYSTKREGVVDIANKVLEVSNVPLGFVGQDGMIEYDELLKNPMNVAASNWIATSKLAANICPDCIMIDTGSTTTDIIPILNSRECSQGRTDLGRLATGELVYTGLLRTNLATLVDKVPLKDNWVRVASELFTITADVHMVLGNINEEDYTCSTPDAGGKSIEECLQRIARLVCADMELLDVGEVEEIAAYIYNCQVSRVAEALSEVSQRRGIDEVIATGLGMDIIGKEATNRLGLNYTGMDTLLTKEQCKVAPAVGTALMMESYLNR